MLEALKQRVYEANMALVEHGLVVFTWGNASELDPKHGLYAIKPSGVDYAQLTPEAMVLCNMDGEVIEGQLKPSSDNATHARLYRAWAEQGVCGIVHTHSNAAVAWAQAGRSIPCYGTTHADYFYGEIPCMRGLSEREIAGAYELATGDVIVEGFEGRNPLAQPGCLVHNHGPFSWGKDAAAAVYHAVVMEEVARMARDTELLCASVNKPLEDARAPQHLLDKHYQRKHGANAYYGQS